MGRRRIGRLSPALIAIWRAGQVIAFLTISMPCRWSSFLPLSFSIAFPGAQQRDPAARQDAFLDCGAGRMHSIVDAVLALLYLGLGGAAHTDYRNAAGEFGQPLLQFLLVVVGGGLLDLRLDLIDARLDVGLLAGAVDDRGVLLSIITFLALPSMASVTFFEATQLPANRLVEITESTLLRDTSRTVADLRAPY